MMIQFRATPKGGHHHVSVRAGVDREHLGACGNLCMRREEWEAFRDMLLNGQRTAEWSVQDDTDVVAVFDTVASMTAGLDEQSLRVLGIVFAR